MFRILKYQTFSVVCGLFLMSTIVFAQSNSGKRIVFPEVEGWEKGEINTYPTAALGYSIMYQQSETVIPSVTIYVYNGGLNKIADGIDDANVKNEIKKAENDLKAFGEAGYYQEFKFVKNETVTLGGNSGPIRSLYSLFSFKVRGAPVDSEIYLFGYRNNFIKIRATRAKGKNGAENAEVNKLLTEIGKIFTK